MSQRTKKRTNRKMKGGSFRSGYKKRSKKVMKGGSGVKSVAIAGLILSIVISILISGYALVKYKLNNSSFNNGTSGENTRDKLQFLVKYDLDSLADIFGVDINNLDPADYKTYMNDTYPLLIDHQRNQWFRSNEHDQ